MVVSPSIAIEEISFNPEFPDRPWVSQDVHRQELSTISLAWANQGRFHEKRLNLLGTFLSFRHRRQVIGDFQVPITTKACFKRRQAGSTVAQLQHDNSTTWFQTSNLIE